VTRFCVGDWLVEPTLNSLSRPDRIVRLEPKVMQVLVCLAEHPGEVASKDRLLQRVWPGTYVTEDVLTRAVSELRRVFGDDAKHSRFIETIPKGGYRLVAQVAPTSESGGTATEAMRPTGGAVGDVFPRFGSTSPRPAPGLSRARFRPARQPILLAAALAVVLAGGAWASWGWFFPGSPAVTNSRPLTRSGRVMFPDRYLMHFPGLATDGTQVYFSQGMMGSSWGEALAYVPMTGETPGVMRTPFQRQIVHHISPDRSRLLVQEQTTALGLDQGEGALWALPVAGQGPLRLGDMRAHDGAWSSTGTQLAFANGHDLYLARWDGSDPRKLVTTPGRAYWIRWAPDDHALRFTLTESGSSRTSLWEVRIDGTGLRRLLSDWRSDAQPCCGEWSPDGRHFVFLAYEDKRSEIWIRREPSGFWRAASEPVRLTSGPLSFASVIFSGDGGRLLAVSPQIRGKVNRFNLIRRAIEPSQIEGVCQRFSPDRQWVLYQASGSLWRSRPNGSEALQLTAPPLQAACVTSWSPDGKRVAFSGRTPGGPYKLYVVSSSGGAVRQLIPGNRQEIDVSWSPDGHAIMFGRPPDVLAEPGMPKGIYVLDLKTGNTKTLPGSEGMFSPRWTPEGRFVIAMPHDTWDRLMRFDCATRKWSVLVPYHATGPQLSPDGEWVYFESEHGGSHLGRARLRDGHLERVVDFAEVTKGTPMSCATAMGVDLDGSPFLHCSVNASELYALDLDLP
jgi:DNA-binding winged helix-turn-helix (wHTH) protein/Tol biopolymer transport system component